MTTYDDNASTTKIFEVPSIVISTNSHKYMDNSFKYKEEEL